MDLHEFLSGKNFVRRNRRHIYAQFFFFSKSYALQVIKQKWMKVSKSLRLVLPTISYFLFKADST
jgi:hypothetical protein